MKTNRSWAPAGQSQERISTRLKPVALCVLLALSQFVTDSARANAGYGVNTNIAGNNIAVPTFYANTPQGWQPALDATNQPIINPATGAPYTAMEAYLANGGSVNGSVVPMIDTGTPLRKFVDPLPGAYNGLSGAPTANIPMGVPVGIPDKWVDSSGAPVNGNQDDFYELAVVEYTQQLHSDLPKATRLRGYVQIETANIRNNKLTDASGVIGSEHIPGKYPDGTPILDAKGNQVYFVHAPHYLGPSLMVTKGKAVRMLVHNYLPYTDINGKSVGSAQGNGGELPVPVDDHLAGGGPLTQANGKPYLINGKPANYGHNRVTIHLHGGDTPWISDGTPHQWFAPAGDVAWTLKDANHPYGLGRGESFQNVPDMPDPGQGSQTLYFPNNQSGRIMWFHDHTSALTRLNVYMGMAAGYFIADPDEQALVAGFLGTTPTAKTTVTSGPLAGKTINSGLLDTVGIPLVIQDRTFVPKNAGTTRADAKAGTVATNTAGRFQSQDAKWNTQHWGGYGDLWFPHVYETNQDPNAINGTNPVGRWDWGPWFWPVFPAQYSLPSGAYGDVTTTPEAFVDTPMVNGVVYPTLTVDPKTYRFRVMSVGNDRSLNLGIYVAVDGAGNPCDINSNPTPAPNPKAPGQLTNPTTCTEMRMVPASNSSGLPTNWPTDGRAGGVPDPLTIGPDIVQIGNETGLLPTPAVWPAQPVTFDQNVRSMTVLNVLNHQLLLAPAERADVLVDFSQYAGKTLILYNDGPAPMPGFDPRIDYYTGVGNQTDSGGAYDTLPGYGPNTRTIMQIKVNNAPAAAPLNVAALSAAMAPVYAKTRPQPLVPESAYSIVFPNAQNAGDNYAHIYTGSQLQPAFSYPMRDASGAVVSSGVQIGSVNSTTGLLDLTGAVTVSAGGSGYTSVPAVTFSPAPVAVNGPAPTATATVSNGQVTGVTISNMTNGYFPSTPTVLIAAPPASSNASATLSTLTTYTLGSQTLTVATANGGSGYTTVPQVTINGTLAAGQTAPTVSATVSGGKVTSIRVTGSAKYTTAPTFTIAAPRTGTTATAPTPTTSTGVLDTVQVTSGGSGYLQAPAVSFTPAVGNSVRATAVLTNGSVSAINLSNPSYVFAAGTKINIATAPVNQPAKVTVVSTVPAMNRMRVINKAIQELFDPVYGRMNATLAVELPYSSATVATTIPLAYVDTPVDYIDGIQDGETQVWKVTHNGVDSHPVHFHLVNVQVINRVDWAGVIKPPQANEIGWKETLRMNPLEDVYVAVRAVRPVAPFGIPRSQRLMDPSQAAGGQAGLTQIDPLTGNAPTYQTEVVNGVTTNVAVTAYSNQLTDFDNEYIWHCHILGHEENDFMRPFIFHPTVAVPDAPGLVTVSGTTVKWSDPTPLGGYDAQGVPTAGLDASGNLQASPKNEVGFRVYTAAPGKRAVLLATVPANTTQYVDTTGTVNKAGYVTTVSAYNAAGESLQGGATTAASGILGSSTQGQAIATSGTTAAASATAADVAAATTAEANAQTVATNAVNSQIASAKATAAQDAAIAAAVAAAPVQFAQVTPLGAPVPGSVVLHWANNPTNIDATNGYTNVTSFTLSWSGAGTGTALIQAPAGFPVATGATVTGLASGGAYTFTLVANAPGGTSSAVTLSANAQ